MMRFFLKVQAQRFIGLLPYSDAIYVWLQRRLTGSVSPRASDVMGKRAIVRDYLDMAARLAGKSVADLEPHLDIGSGWLLSLPLAFRQAGIKQQVATDIHAGAQLQDVAASAAIFDKVGPACLGQPKPGQDLTAWLSDLGIRYMAPAYAPFDLPAASFGMVTSTQVLMHPAQDVVQLIYAEAARLLRPGGLFIATTKLYDVYRYADPSLTRFNFLRFSHATWERWFQNRFTPYNRMRPSDHRRLIEALPFEILLWEVQGGGPAELAELARIKPHAEFASYPPEELAATGLKVVLRRR
ncbi:class I SAM-dependent methyltransferase [Ferrovibrio sp.]|uniref:class I SAM-dependent methyltransferase n=1 Tax=Ferrovibrio sp. TaxID=1917215 RepID=UPI001B40B509|nr:class I SAM-dependent methyltransferase [Ferrovibrio sp.]MBP7065459.1 class I SAM-dependent methyltransferase [Ferrovibrio sp.]